jgi:hypothetical protein
MMTCETCLKHQTRVLCFHCENPVCARCNTIFSPKEDAPLQIWGCRVCRKCLVKHRRLHALDHSEVHALLKFVFNRD